MANIDYKKIIERAKTCKTGAEKQHKMTITPRWSYYFAKFILNPNKNVVRNPSMNTAEGNAPNPVGDYFSTQIYKKDYLLVCKRLIKYVDEKKRLPNYVRWNDKRIHVRDYTYNLAKIVVWYSNNKALPIYNTINSKVWNKEVEYPESVYNYFVKRLGKFNNTIDGALSLVDGNGYSGYSDDYYSNTTSIDRMANGDGINCTDSCHVFYNIVKHLISLGKYRKVECLHVQCSSGTGHVRLRIQLNDGDWIYRDPASVLDGNGVTSNWCISNYTYWGTDPSWFMENLRR